MVFWSSLLLAAVGLAYAAALGTAAALGALALPPPEPIGSFAAVDTIASAVLLVVLVVGIDVLAPPGRRPLSRLAVVFTAMFAVAVTINRFVQLTIVRQSIAAGDTADLRRFLPYDPRSAMFALEILGWGFFLGLAAVCLVPVMRGPRLRAWIALLLGLYGLLGLSCALGSSSTAPWSRWASWRGAACCRSRRASSRSTPGPVPTRRASPERDGLPTARPPA